MQSRSAHPRNFKLISKFNQIRPIFPDYLSVSYEYGISDILKYLRNNSYFTKPKERATKLNVLHNEERTF